MRRMITQKMIDYIKGLQSQMSFDGETGKVVFKDALFIEANGVSAPIFLDFDSEDNPIIGVNALKVDTFVDIGSDVYVAGDASIAGDVVAETLKQNSANYSTPLTLAFSNANFEIVGTPYSKIEVVNGEIHIIFAGLVHNKAESSQTGYLSGAVSLVPEEIGSKIYSVGGNTLDEAPSLSAIENIIRIVPCGYRAGSVTNSVLLNLVHTSANQLSITQTGSFVIGADDYCAITFEANLSLF